MLRRIIAWSVLISPLVLATAVPAAGAAVGSPSGPSAVPAPAAAMTARTAAAAAAQPVLRLGSRGAAVTTLQQRLAALHYFDVGRADGVFGANTYHAVVAFQKVQGLTRDGIVGPATRTRLARPYVPAPR
ncbi:MAG TPA: peptidoglycan-binding domain-containing protein, partial [Streptosporangiaceae bacterium]